MTLSLDESFSSRPADQPSSHPLQSTLAENISIHYRKFLADRMRLSLECADVAIDLEALRAHQAEIRLESLRDTLATVRAQHEGIFSLYKQLRGAMERGEEELAGPRSVPVTGLQRHKTPTLERQATPIVPVTPILDRTPLLDVGRNRVLENESGSMVKRMRAQLEENARKFGNTNLTPKRVRQFS